MSQPTLARLENLRDWRALARIIDDTDDAAHGSRPLYGLAYAYLTG